MTDAAPATATASTPLTIHASRGKFMVWQPEVCRALAFEWRILGEWSPPRQRQQSWGGGLFGLSHSEGGGGGGEPADGDSNDGLEVGSLPMYLMPAQVLFLLHHAPAAKLLRIVDASTLAGLRTAATAAAAGSSTAAASAAPSPSSSSSAFALTSARDRVAAFKRNAEAQANQQALKRKHFGGTPAVDAADSNERQQLAHGGDTKRQKTDASNGTGPVSPDGFSADSAPADVDAADDALTLPAHSSYQLAIRTFPAPPDAEESIHTGHPTAIALPLLYPLDSEPLIVSTRLHPLELRTVLTHQARPDGVSDWNDMQRLVYENACEALGLRLHGATCSAASASAAAATSFASSPAWDHFLSLYGAFRHLWSLGYLMLPGAHFGGDLMAYEDLPSRVHSSFLVKLLAPSSADAEDVRTAGEGDDHSRQQVDEKELEEKDAEAGAGGFSISMLSNLARMASSINKAVLLVQPRMQPAEAYKDDTGAVPSSSTPTMSSSSLPSSSSCACSCLSSFLTCVRGIHVARMQCHTFHWNLTPSLAHAPFANQHLVRTALDE